MRPASGLPVPEGKWPESPHSAVVLGKPESVIEPVRYGDHACSSTSTSIHASVRIQGADRVRGTDAEGRRIGDVAPGRSAARRGNRGRASGQNVQRCRRRRERPVVGQRRLRAPGRCDSTSIAAAGAHVRLRRRERDQRRVRRLPEEQASRPAPAAQARRRPHGRRLRGRSRPRRRCSHAHVRARAHARSSQLGIRPARGAADRPRGARIDGPAARPRGSCLLRAALWPRLRSRARARRRARGGVGAQRERDRVHRGPGCGVRQRSILGAAFVEPEASVGARAGARRPATVERAQALAHTRARGAGLLRTAADPRRSEPRDCLVQGGCRTGKPSRRRRQSVLHRGGRPHDRAERVPVSELDGQRPRGAHVRAETPARSFDRDRAALQVHPGSQRQVRPRRIHDGLTGRSHRSAPLSGREPLLRNRETRRRADPGLCCRDLGARRG